jgi:hypothetical protein
LRQILEMKKHRFISLPLVASFLLTMNCSTYYKAKSDRLVERLESQIQTGNYKQIYDESSQRAKDYKYSEDEFISRMKTIAEKIREVDETLALQKHKGEYPYADDGAFPPSQYAYRYVEKNEKRIGINISIDSDAATLRLLDFCVYTEKDGVNENPPNDALCVSDASKS